ncbi:MAG: GNAT family N-acetyltransferase [Hyphomicrobiaceae bacterium]
MAISIRPVTISDHQEWGDLFLAYGLFYEVELDPDALATVWAWIFDPREPFWCDVAETASGQIIGLTQYQTMHRSLGGNMVCYLSDLYVEPGNRGAGTGRALIEHVIAFAKAEKLAGVRWLTQEFNYPGRMLYDTFAPRTDFILYNVPVE